MCCSSGRWIEKVADTWKGRTPQSSAIPLLPVGRSTVGKRRRAQPFDPAPAGDGTVPMQASGDKRDEQDPAAGGVQQAGAGGAPQLEHRGAEVRDHGRQGSEERDRRHPPHEKNHPVDYGRVEDQGDGAGGRVPFRDHQGEPPEADPGHDQHPDNELMKIGKYRSN